jgi:hypothetical protein
MAACDSSGKKACVLLWYQARGMRSQAVRGVAWERPARAVVSFWCWEGDGWQGGHTVCAAVVEEDVCVWLALALVLVLVWRDRDFVLVALAGA